MTMIIKESEFEDGIHKVVYVEVSGEDSEM